MKRRIIQKLLRLYPPQWRDEYGTELEDLLLAEPLQPAVVLNVIANALRQQVRVSNHPPSAVSFLAFVLRVSFAFGALSCGLRAMGYWVILQVGGVPPAESGGIALVVYRSSVLVRHPEFGLCLPSRTDEKCVGHRCQSPVSHRCLWPPVHCTLHRSVKGGHFENAGSVDSAGPACVLRPRIPGV